jgi:hypothetical protein
MGFRFRKSIRIGPGLRWNFGKRGSSLSVGGRGATVNIGSRGVRQTVGFPGTGLSYSNWTPWKSKSTSILPSNLTPQQQLVQARNHAWFKTILWAAFGILLPIVLVTGWPWWEWVWLGVGAWFAVRWFATGMNQQHQLTDLAKNNSPGTP